MPPPAYSPSVAICIPTFNQADYLRLAVRSAATQSYAGVCEIWVGDDASSDHTEAVLDELTREFEGLRVVRREKNVGIAVNSSSLLAMPRTDLLVRLDSDDELEPEFLVRLIELMGGAPSAGYGHSAITEIDEHGNRRRERRLARGTGHQDAEAALRASLSGHRAAANIVMFRRSALEELNFYSFETEYVEDYDLSVRMADAGYGNVYVDELLGRYRVWSDAAGVRARRKAMQLSGYTRMFEHTFPRAWERRGWSTRALRRRRERLARHHCASCFGAQNTAQEQQELVGLLRRLGDSRGLRLRIMLCRLGFAALLMRVDKLPAHVKRVVKFAIRVVRDRPRRGLSGPRRGVSAGSRAQEITDDDYRARQRSMA
ncbi:MAG TPA: glycosyltransferase family 2 protein [Solirubrobacteraceae bacterium]|nr:glycosyltransferase family 2 protein [Solirubrobacteraceae bacterium]